MRTLSLSRCLLFCIFCSLISVKGFAQPAPYFEKKIEGSPSRWYSMSALAPSGGMYVATINGTNQQDENGLIQVSRLSGDGTVLWQSLGPVYGTPYAPAYIQFVRSCPDGGVLAVALYDNLDDASSASLLSKFSSSGVNEWNTKVANVVDARVDTDGSVFLATDIDDKGTVLGSVQKLSPTGTLLWEETLGTGVENQTQVTNVLPDGSGGAYGVGTFNGLSFYQTESGFEVDGVVVEDFKGDLKPNILYPQQAVFHQPAVGDNSRGLARDKAGNFYTTSNSTSYASTNLLKLDPNGSLLWSLALPENQFGSLGLDGLGNPVFAGYQGGGIDGGPQVAAVTKATPDGAISWTRTYNGGLGNVGIDFVSDSGGDIMLLLLTQNATTGEDSGIIKYLWDGSLGWPTLTNGVLFFNSADDDFATSIHRDAAGELYLGGYYSTASDVHGVIAAKYQLPDNSNYITQSLPSTMIAGQSYTVSESFGNMGINTWTRAGGYYLRSVNPTDNLTWGRNRVDLSPSESILTGQAKTFTFTAVAPMAGGTYNFQWKTSQGIHAFGAASVNRAVTVVVAANAARYILLTTPSSVAAGSTFNVSVTMKNVGTTTWTQAAGFGLAPAPGNPTWGVTKIAMGAADSIARGSTKTFTFSCTAPSTAGNYSMRWRMRRDSGAFTGFFGDLTPAKTITVTP